MLRLLNYLYLKRVLFVFIFLELSCFMLIKDNSPYYSAYYFTSSNQFVGDILQKKTNIISYLSLIEENDKLRNSNALLKKNKFNSSSSYIYPKRSFKNNYFIRESKIINNTISYSENYLTLDVGLKDKISVGQGVISEQGLIGVVKSVSDNFSTVTSILHKKMMVSVKIGKEKSLCSLIWDGEDYKFANILHLPKHVKINKNDTVITSGFGGVFPEEIIVGHVSTIETQKDQSFHKIKIELINDFSSVNTAYVVIDKNKEEIESLTILENE